MLGGEPMARLRVVQYLLSRQNLVGCGLALVGVGLALTDPVGPAGLILVVAFYLLGVAAGRPGRRIHRYGFDPRSVERALSDEISAVSGRVPPEVIIRLQRIDLTLRSEILPRLDCLPFGSYDLYLIQRTGREDVPKAVETYLQLPADYVSSHPGDPGRPALHVLIEELDLMDAEMRRIAEVVHRADMDRLLAHRRFLNDRFTPNDVLR
jgi:hypothetical protein